MGNYKKINEVGLKGKEKKSRVMDLMEKLDVQRDNVLENSNVEHLKIGPDNKVYGIVRENKRYYIKRGDIESVDENGTPIIGENDLKYIGNVQNKKKYEFPSYSRAVKQMGMLFTNITESNGDDDFSTKIGIRDNIILKEDRSPDLDKTEKSYDSEEKNDSTILFDEEGMHEEELSEEEKEIDKILNGESTEPKTEGKGEKKNKMSIKEAVLNENNNEDNDSEDENNPWAICNAQANKEGGWSDEKIERCVKDVKKQNESAHGKKKVGEDLGQEEGEEEPYDYEEGKRYVLRDPDLGDDPEGAEGEEGGDDLSDLDFDDVGSEEEGGENKPFDDSEFDPDVEASEEEEPKKFIQQLTGKLSQSLRSLSKEEGTDTDLEQYVVNMVLDAISPEEFEEHERQEIIDRLDQEKEDPGEPELKGDEEEGEGEDTGTEEEPAEDGIEGDEGEESIEDELGDELKGDEEEQEK